jgi:uncharacterized protein (DUF305 family)
MRNRSLLGAALSFSLALSASGLAYGQQMRMKPGTDMGSGLPAASASTQAYKDVDARMMQQMDAVPYTGDADKDFVAHMIPHHQGAIDMAQVELKYGKDPAMRRLAQDIVMAQRNEIALMKKWQAAHP